MNKYIVMGENDKEEFICHFGTEASKSRRQTTHDFKEAEYLVYIMTQAFLKNTYWIARIV